MQLTPTDRLYFGKYPYKIDFNLQGVSVMRYRGIDWVKKYCGDINLKTLDDKKINREKLLSFINTIEPYISKEDGFKTRTELTKFSYFTANLSDVQALAKELEWCCTKIWGPSTQQELDYLLSNRRKLLCEHLPYGQYKFKVQLRESTPTSVKTQFYNWANNYSNDDISISHSTASWLSGARRYCQAPFFYIKDEKLLTFASIFLSNHINSVHEYIPRHTVI
jgi:hypothetical protein